MPTDRLHMIPHLGQPFCCDAGATAWPDPCPWHSKVEVPAVVKAPQGDDAKRRAELDPLNEWYPKERAAAVEEPPPVPNAEEPVYKRVMADVEARAQKGRGHYGTYLQPDNGRDFLMDAYQEALDLVAYLAQGIMEREKHNGLD